MKPYVTSDEFYHVFGKLKPILDLQNNIYRQWDERAQCDSEERCSDFIEECFLVLYNIINRQK